MVGYLNISWFPLSVQLLICWLFDCFCISFQSIFSNDVEAKAKDDKKEKEERKETRVDEVETLGGTRWISSIKMMTIGESVAFVSFYISLIEVFHHLSIFSSRIQRTALLNESLRTLNDYSNRFLSECRYTHAIMLPRWLKDWLLSVFCMQDPTFSERKFSFSMAKAVILWMKAEYVCRNQLWLWNERRSCFRKCYSNSNCRHYDELFSEVRYP